MTIQYNPYTLHTHAQVISCGIYNIIIISIMIAEDFFLSGLNMVIENHTLLIILIIYSSVLLFYL